MPETKYEIRSTEVQEVMNRPPHAFITWGNTIILLILISAVLILNRIKLPLKEHLPASFDHIGTPFNKNNGVSQLLVFSVNAKMPGTVKINQKAVINLAGAGMADMGDVFATLDSSWEEKGITFIVLQTESREDGQLVTAKGKVIVPVKGLSMRVDITTREMNVLDYLLYSLF
jgi:hypothetical protein